MNIVVAMKQIPDLQQIRIRNRKPILDDVALTFGNIDKNALEAGVQLKEATGSNLIVVSVGTEALEDTIKEALAAGADEAYLVLDDEIGDMESSSSARLIAEAIKKIDDVGIILFGEGSGDNYSGQVGSRVAAILGLPQAGYAKSININGNIATVTRSLEDCEEVLEAELPIVVSVIADINEPRIPSVTQILKAGRKPKEMLELDVTGDSMLETISNLAPEMQRKQIEIETIEKLLKVLENEGLLRR
ncbi:MAG: electron transfer flavoprotein subunit alpha [Firmicutes bacterium HGW-Firmicutes-15]|nr:MAG: electron transfer flavoprotein subunit alpha [Firmicutes bacterium HGW-Firmicutes-15]